MRIGELSRRAGVSASRIRFYEKRKLLPPAVRGANGYRDYPCSAEATLSLIDGAQRLGFSLGQIRVGLGGSETDFPSPAAVAEALREKLTSVEQHIEEAQARRRHLMQLMKEMGA
jgi:DNA-binding transcriptional MerR regulator